MIIEYSGSDIGKQSTRELYEEVFDDPKDFVDYYYSDKCIDNRMFVSIEDGEVVSMLHLNPYSINLCGSVVHSYYVVAVATRKEYRHKGHMKKLFEKAFEVLLTEHVPFVFLMPVDESIYSWMGFERICDFTVSKVKYYELIQKLYDVYCVQDENYVRRMTNEDELRKLDMGEALPEDPLIMARITDLNSFNEAVSQSFASEHEALEYLRGKNIYICEEV